MRTLEGCDWLFIGDYEPCFRTCIAAVTGKQFSGEVELCEM